MIDIADLEDDIGLVNPYFAAKRKTAAAEGPYLEVDFCRGFCMLIKRKVIEGIGLLD